MKTTRLERQRDVAAARLDAHVRSIPGAPVDYVGSRGESWQVPSEKTKKKKTKDTSAATTPPRAVYFAGGPLSVLSPGLVQTSELSMADAVFVKDFFESDGPAGVHARILGLRILDASGTDVKFVGVKKSQTYYGTPSFCSEHPHHIVVLSNALARAGCKFKAGKVFKAKKLKNEGVVFWWARLSR